MKDKDENEPILSKLSSTPTESAPTGMQLSANHGMLPGLLSFPFMVEAKAEPPNWLLVTKELQEVLPDELLDAHSWLPPVKLVEIAVRECPGALLGLSPEALDVVRASRLADILAQATYRNGRGRIVNGQRLKALWETEPARDVVFDADTDAAVWSFAESVERIEQSPLEVAQAIVETPEQFISGEDNGDE